MGRLQWFRSGQGKEAGRWYYRYHKPIGRENWKGYIERYERPRRVEFFQRQVYSAPPTRKQAKESSAHKWRYPKGLADAVTKFEVLDVWKQYCSRPRIARKTCLSALRRLNEARGVAQEDDPRAQALIRSVSRNLDRSHILPDLISRWSGLGFTRSLVTGIHTLLSSERLVFGMTYKQLLAVFLAMDRSRVFNAEYCDRLCRMLLPYVGSVASQSDTEALIVAALRCPGHSLTLRVFTDELANRVFKLWNPNIKARYDKQVSVPSSVRNGPEASSVIQVLEACLGAQCVPVKLILESAQAIRSACETSACDPLTDGAEWLHAAGLLIRLIEGVQMDSLNEKLKSQIRSTLTASIQRYTQDAGGVITLTDRAPTLFVRVMSLSTLYWLMVCLNSLQLNPKEVASKLLPQLKQTTSFSRIAVSDSSLVVGLLLECLRAQFDLTTIEQHLRGLPAPRPLFDQNIGAASSSPERKLSLSHGTSIKLLSEHSEILPVLTDPLFEHLVRSVSNELWSYDARDFKNLLVLFSSSVMSSSARKRAVVSRLVPQVTAYLEKRRAQERQGVPSETGSSEVLETLEFMLSEASLKGRGENAATRVMQ